MSITTAPEVGEIVSERYRIISHLGHGGIGGVYLAADRVLGGQHVAIKFLHPELAGDQLQCRRLLREVELTRSIDSEHIVRSFDVGQDGALLYFTMEALQGESLKEILHRGGGAEPELALRFWYQTCLGLKALHDNGIIHRDIKPANIFVTESQVVKLLDFGLARPDESNLTKSIVALGSAPYMAPEIWKGENAHHQSDLYALAVTGFELFAGQPLFPGDSSANMMYHHLRTIPVRLQDVRPDVPLYLSQLIECMLQKELNSRPYSIDNVINALDRKECSLEELFDRTKPLTPIAEGILHSSNRIVVPPSQSSSKSINASRFFGLLFIGLLVLLGIYSAVKLHSLPASSPTSIAQEAESHEQSVLSVVVPQSVINARLWLKSNDVVLDEGSKDQLLGSWKNSAVTGDAVSVKQKTHELRPRLRKHKGFHVVQFDGVDDHFVVSNLQQFLRNADGVSVIVVARAGNTALFSGRKRDAQVLTVFQMPNRGYTVDVSALKVGLQEDSTAYLTVQTTARISSRPLQNLGSLKIFTVMSEVQNSVLFVNGKEEIRFEKPSRFRLSRAAEIIIGFDPDYGDGKRSVSDIFSGDIAEFIVIDQFLEESERKQIEAYLGQKYRIQQ